jgi:hypothetical protein
MNTGTPTFKFFDWIALLLVVVGFVWMNVP